MSSELRSKGIKAVVWNLVGRFGLMFINFFIGIIIARLLSPDDYGLIAMISIFISLSEVLIRSGLGEALVQKKELEHVDSTTIFYSNLLISSALYLLLWILAPQISAFYDQPILTNLTRILGLTLIIQAFTIIQATILRRNLDYKRNTKIITFASVVSGILGVTAAYADFGVWSLVIKSLASSSLIAIGLWISSSWRPTLEFSVKSFKTMFSFGAWVLGTNLIKTFFENIYKLVIGKLFPTAQLGFYTKAKDTQGMGSTQITQAISSVSFSVFSRLQDDKEKMQEALKLFITNTVAIIVPVMVTLIVVAKPFVILLLTEKWAPMIPFLQVFCILGILYPLEDLNLKVLLALGKSKYNFNVSLLKNLLTIVNILVMYNFGVLYIIAGEVLLTFIAILFGAYYTRQLIDYGFLKQLADISKTLIIGIAAGGITYLVISYNYELWFMLIEGVVLTVGLYLLFQYYFNRIFFTEIKKIRGFFSKPKAA